MVGNEVKELGRATVQPDQDHSEALGLYSKCDGKSLLLADREQGKNVGSSLEEYFFK